MKKLSQSISAINKWKMELSKPEPKPTFVFRPLTAWPAIPHRRQDEIDAFINAPSRYA